MPTLARIHIHPIKSLDAQSVDSAVLMAGGALQHDRRFALRDSQGEFINGKRTPRVHRLRSRFDPATDQLELRVEGSNTVDSFDVYSQRAALEAWLSRYFEQQVEWIEDSAAGFPDDTDSPGPTLISTGTLEAVAGWFEGMSIAKARGRFRANLEIDGVEAFWEDQLVAGAGARCGFASERPNSGAPIRVSGVSCPRAILVRARRLASLPGCFLNIGGSRCRRGRRPIGSIIFTDWQSTRARPRVERACCVSAMMCGSWTLRNSLLIG